MVESQKAFVQSSVAKRSKVSVECGVFTGISIAQTFAPDVAALQREATRKAPVHLNNERVVCGVTRVIDGVSAAESIRRAAEGSRGELRIDYEEILGQTGFRQERSADARRQSRTIQKGGQPCRIVIGEEARKKRAGPHRGGVQAQGSERVHQRRRPARLNRL